MRRVSSARSVLLFRRMTWCRGVVVLIGALLGAGCATGLTPVPSGDIEPYPFGRRFETETVLPTAAMIDAALPARVVPPGEAVTGLVYFPRALHALGDVAFDARLVDAATGRVAGVAAIPFRRE